MNAIAMNATRIRSRLRSALVNSALAVAVAVGLGAGSTQALTTTSVIDLGSPGSGTYFSAPALVPEINQGVLPVGSILRSVTLNYTLEGGVPYLGDLAPLFADSTADNGVLAIIGNPNDGGFPKDAATTVSWNSGGDYSIGATASATLTAADGIPPIDLHDHTVWLMMEANYDGTFSGSVTLEYDVPPPASIVAFGPGAVINQDTKTISWVLPYGSSLTQSPTYTLSSGSCVPVSNPSPAIDFSDSVAHPVSYVVTDGGTINEYLVTVTVGSKPDELNVSTYLGIDAQALLDPISNLIAATPTATGTTTAAINYHGSSFATLPGAPGPNDFSVLWEGWFDVTKDGHGVYTFGTSSDDGSVIYLDLNNDGNFTSPGERIVNNNNYQGDTSATGEVDLEMDSVHMVIGYYQGGGGYDMRAAFKKGSGLGFGDLTLINSSSGYFFTTDPHPPLAKILTYQIAGYAGVIDQVAKTIRVVVPYGTAVTSLTPSYTVTSGIGAPASGVPQDFTNPVHTIVTDGSTVNDYTVTVWVAPNETTLVWNTGSGAWDLVTPNWNGQASGLPMAFWNGVNVLFSSTAGGTIDIAAGIAPASTTVSAASGTYTFGGQPITTGSLTKSGGGQLVINTANTLTGGASIQAGSLYIGVPNLTNPLGTGTTTVNSGATYDLNRTFLTDAAPLTLNGGTLTAGNSFTSTISGPVTLDAVSTISISGNLTISGNISGAGGLTKTLGTFVPVTGTNTYTGPTTISGGGLIFKSSLYGNDPAQWTPANITVTNGAALVLNVGGAAYGEFTIDQASTLFTHISTGVNNNGLQAGSVFGVDTNSAGAGTTTTYSAVIADSTGPGGGAVGFKHFGPGTLELTGTNTYSGLTITDGNGTLKVSSINSVATNPSLGTVHSASSSLGAPTTVTNGTIWLGQTTYQGGNLLYTGTGETTDRAIMLGGGGNETYVFDQSGSGLLKFISDIAMSDTRGPKTIVLQGSTAGTGEFAGVIPNATSATPITALTKSGSGTWTLSGVNLYAGTTTVSGGKLVINGTNSGTGAVNVSGGAALGGSGTIAGATTIADGGKLAFTLSTPAASHQKLSISNTLTFAGASELDITAGGAPAAGIYTLVSATGGISGSAPATLILPPGWTATVSISGNDLLLNVTFIGGYVAWAATNAPTGGASDDYDGDGVSNGVEYVVGGSKNTNDLGKLPTIATSGGNLVFTFKRDQASIDGSTAVSIEVGTDLVTWPDSYTVGADTAGSSPGVTIVKDSPTGFDTVTLTVPQGPGTGKFARLKVTVPTP